MKNLTKDQRGTLLELIDNELQFLSSYRSEYTPEEEKAKREELEVLQQMLKLSDVKRFRVVTKEIHRTVMIVEANSDEEIEEAIANGRYEVEETSFVETDGILRVEEVKE